MPGDNTAVNVVTNDMRMPRGDRDPRIAQRLAIIVGVSLAFLVIVRIGLAGRVLA